MRKDLLQEVVDWYYKDSSVGMLSNLVDDIKEELAKPEKEPTAYLTVDKRMLVFADKALNPSGMIPLYEHHEELLKEVELLSNKITNINNAIIDCFGKHAMACDGSFLVKIGDYNKLVDVMNAGLGEKND